MIANGLLCMISSSVASVGKCALLVIGVTVLWRCVVERFAWVYRQRYLALIGTDRPTQEGHAVAAFANGEVIKVGGADEFADLFKREVRERSLNIIGPWVSALWVMAM